MELSLSLEVDSVINSLAMTIFELVLQNGKLDDDQYIMQQINDIYDDESTKTKIKDYLYRRIQAHKRGEEWVDSDELVGKTQLQEKSVTEACVSDCYYTIVIRSVLSVSDISKDVILAVVNKWESLSKDQMDDLFLKEVKMFKLDGDSIIPYQTVLGILASKISEEAKEAKKDKSLDFVKAFLAKYKFNDVGAAKSVYAKLVSQWKDTKEDPSQRKPNPDWRRTSMSLPVPPRRLTRISKSVVVSSPPARPSDSPSGNSSLPLPPCNYPVQPNSHRPALSSTLHPTLPSLRSPPPSQPLPPRLPSRRFPLPPRSPRLPPRLRSPLLPPSPPRLPSQPLPPPPAMRSLSSDESQSIPSRSSSSTPTRIHLSWSKNSVEDKKQAKTLAERFGKDEVSLDSEEGRTMMEEMFHDLFTRVKMTHLIKRWIVLMKDPLYNTYVEVAQKQTTDSTDLLPEILNEVFPGKDVKETSRIIQFLSFPLC